MSRRAVLVAVGAAGALLLLWFVLLWGPQGGQLTDARERRTAAEEENDLLSVRLARLQAAQKEAPALMADLDELRRAVPDDPQLAEFILDANTAASDAGVDFLSISPGEPTLEPPLPPTILLNIGVTGEYFSVLDYLDRLDDLPRIVVIDALGLTPSQDATGREALSVQITARMFANSAPQIEPIEGEAVPETTTSSVPASDEQVTTSTMAPVQITLTPTTTEASNG